MTRRKPPARDSGDDIFMPAERPEGPALSAEDGLPAPPYRVSKTRDLAGGGWCEPFTVVAGDGRAVAGHVPSLEIARAIAFALNAAGAVRVAAE
jgi:hypothetical protein